MHVENNTEKKEGGYLALPIWLRLIISTFSVSLLLVSTQDLQIFPGAAFTLFKGAPDRSDGIPDNVEAFFVTTSDGESIEVWRLPGERKTPVVIVLHGNGGDIANFFPYQQYLQQFGLTTYGFDYRGYGRSTGWPSEQGLYHDADAVMAHVLEKENIEAKDVMLFGISIGSGPAGYLASTYHPGAVVLLAPFWSLPEAIRATPLFGLLAPFSFYDFPVGENVKKLSSTCLIVAHGMKDRVIPFEQGKRVYEAYSGKAHSAFLTPEDGSHNTLLRHSHPQLAKEMFACFGLEAPVEVES